MPVIDQYQVFLKLVPEHAEHESSVDDQSCSIGGLEDRDQASQGHIGKDYLFQYSWMFECYFSLIGFFFWERFFDASLFLDGG